VAERSINGVIRLVSRINRSHHALRRRTRIPRRVAALGVLALVGAACLPVQKNAPPLSAPPPDVGLPANSPTLNLDTNYVNGLDRPWDLAFLPSGTLLYTENDRATISAYVNSGEPRRVLGTIAGVDTSGEGGLMGLAVDPDFATNRFLYFCVSNLSPSGNRVVRTTLDPNLPSGTALSAPTPIITGMAHQGFHDGCRLRFQPGASPAALFVTMGDAAVGSAPQDPESLNGKILRVQTDGSPYPSNPFFDGGVNKARIFTFGHRNPQGIAFRPGLNTIYSVEHGPDRNDEVNWLGPGANGGWNPVPGYNQGVTMTDLVKYPNAMRPVWRSGDGGTIAPSGATFLSGSQWKALDGALAVAVLKGSQLRLMYLDGPGNVTGSTAILHNGVRLRSVVEGPDGALYISTDQRNASTTSTPQDQIWRIVPS
jgi:aldose sugar dehydrogenase